MTCPRTWPRSAAIPIIDAAHASKSSKQLLAEIDSCHRDLAKLGHVNKKALDQFKNFSDQRDKLIERQQEVVAGESKIRELIDHLDAKKAEVRPAPPMRDRWEITRRAIRLGAAPPASATRAGNDR